MEDNTGNLVKKAASMLLNGATLSAQPCPYCKGVRVMNNGSALCVSCGSEPEEREIPEEDKAGDGYHTVEILEEKLVSLSKELAVEKDHQREIDILDSISAVMAMLEKAKGRG